MSSTFVFRGITVSITKVLNSYTFLIFNPLTGKVIRRVTSFKDEEYAYQAACLWIDDNVHRLIWLLLLKDVHSDVHDYVHNLKHIKKNP